MRIFTRYLVLAHLGPFLFAFFALTGVILINTLARRLADLAGKGLPGAVILEFFVLALPATVALTFPMAVLVAVLHTFSTMVAENEITALKASGIDLRRLLAPILVAAAFLTVAMTWFNDRVLPEANHRWSRLIVDIARKTPTFMLSEQTLNRIAPVGGGRTYFIRAARIEPGTNRMWDVQIFDVGDPSRFQTVFADSGVAAFAPGGTDMVLELHHGHTREARPSDPASFQRVYFERQVFGIPNVATTLTRTDLPEGYRGDREMTIGMLQAQIDTLRAQWSSEIDLLARSARRDLALALGEPDPADTLAAVVATADDPAPVRPGTVADADARTRARRTAEVLANGSRRIANVEESIRNFEVEIHKKYSIAVASLVFVIVGAPLALRFGSGGVGMVIATSMIVFSLYYIGLIGGESLAGRGIVTPVVAMWGMNAVMLVIGLVGLATMGRETSTARTSAWDALLQAVRDAAHAPLSRLRSPRG
jgi:lipopolysaccharide export system permease protein